MVQNLKQCVIQIRDVGGNIQGTGFIIDANTAVTCAHVIEDVGATPGDSVTIAFALTGDTCPAEVLSDAWSPPEKEDIAILRLQGESPAGINPAILWSNDKTTAHSFRTLGYPEMGIIEGVWGEGRILGFTTDSQGTKILQIDSQHIAPGMSGAPVLDTDDDRIIGMVTTTYNPDSTLKFRDTAFATPIEAIKELWPLLLELKPPEKVTSQRPVTYLAPFQAPPLPQHFVPRPEVTDALKARLLSDEPTTPGILVVSAIHGLGGIGKSTLAAALAYDKEVQERFPDGILWATLGQQPEILSLISGWIHAMRDYDFRPTTIEAASVHLRTLLQDKAILLVVDDVWNPAHAIHFKIGGPHCQVLITTRRADVADEVGAELHQMDVMTPEQSLDLLAARLGKTEWEETERKEALSLAEAVGYLPLALELAAVRVARGMSWTALCQALDQEIAHLEALEGPRQKVTLQASLNLSLNALRVENEVAWYAFAWLGVLPEDEQIAAPMTVMLWGMTEFEADKTLELLENDALLMRGSQIRIGENRWLLYRLHDLLHDIARKLLITDQPQGLGFITLPEVHATLLDRYHDLTQNGPWHTLPEDSYIHSHLTWHFQQAEQIEQIHALLREETPEGRNGWYQSRERLGQTKGFLKDVNFALEWAEQDHNIGLQCRYALMIASLNSLAKNIPPALISALVAKGIWTPEQGVAYARQIPGLLQRRETCIGLVPYVQGVLLQDVLQEVLITTQAIEREFDRERALIELIPRLPEELLQEALMTIQTILSGPYQVEALSHLAPYLPEELLREALIATQGLESDYWGAEALVKLAPHLPEELLREALMITQTIGDKERGAWALFKLAPHLTETLLREALVITQTIGEQEYRTWVLVEIAPYLPEPLLREALITAKAIEDEKCRAEALTGLAPYLPKRLKERTLREALMVAQAIVWEEDRREALVRLAPYLPKSLLRKALKATQRIQDERVRAETLSGLASHLPQALLQKALRTTRRIRDERTQAEALAELALCLPEKSRNTVLQEALVVAQGIKWEEDLVTEMLSIQQIPWWVRKALIDAQEIERKEKVWSELSTFGWVFGFGQRSESGGNRVKVWPELVPYLSKVLLREALVATQMIVWEKVRAGVLTEVVQYLPETLLRDTLIDLKQYWISVGENSINALADLLLYLPEALLQKVLRAVISIEDKGGSRQRCWRWLDWHRICQRSCCERH